jgi:cytochrome c553
MRKLLKWFGISLAGFFGIMLMSAVIVTVISNIRWKREYENFDIRVASNTVPVGGASAARGEHVATTRYCGYCHGENLAGDYVLNEPAMAVVPAPNLTAGEGGIGSGYSDEDWVRAIRHGMGRDGRGLVAMPSRIWHTLSDQDLADLIAYLKDLPPIDNELPARSIGPMGRLMVALGQFPDAEAAVIDHDAPRPHAPDKGDILEYGAYLSYACRACHGMQLNGGTIRATSGELVVALNLTPGGRLASWSEEDFFNALRTGETPEGRQLSEKMPWQYVGELSDEELHAVWKYLQSLPAEEQNLERTDR